MREVIDSRDRSASPVFVDMTGRRRRRLRRLGYAAAALCGGYAIMIGISLTGGPVKPQTLLPKVGRGGEIKIAPSPKHRPSADDGAGALSPPPASRPVRKPEAPPAARRVSGGAPSGSVPSGGVPSPPTSDERRRTVPRAPARTPSATPSRSAGTPPKAPPTSSPSPSATPPAPVEPGAAGEPAAAGERHGSSGALATGAEPHVTAATAIVAESGPTAPAAGAEE